MHDSAPNGTSSVAVGRLYLTFIAKIGCGLHVLYMCVFVKLTKTKQNKEKQRQTISLSPSVYFLAVAR